MTLPSHRVLLPLAARLRLDQETSLKRKERESPGQQIPSYASEAGGAHAFPFHIPSARTSCVVTPRYEEGCEEDFSYLVLNPGRGEGRWAVGIRSRT